MSQVGPHSRDRVTLVPGIDRDTADAALLERRLGLKSVPREKDYLQGGIAPGGPQARIYRTGSDGIPERQILCEVTCRPECRNTRQVLYKCTNRS
ncbi:hypothetical protein FKM82_029867 [Ascaphus truei]